MKILHKEINHWLAFLVIFILIAVASATIAVSANATGFLSFGGRIFKYVPACTPFSGCWMCGPGPWGEVMFIPFGGDTAYVCPLAGFMPYGAGFMPGFQILGWSVTNYLIPGLSQVGTSP